MIATVSDSKTLALLTTPTLPAEDQETFTLSQAPADQYKNQLRTSEAS